MASLYELTQQARMLQDMLENGDIDEEMFSDTLEAMEVDSKIENICKVIRNLDTDAKAFKEEKDRLAARQKAAENGVKRLKESLVDYLLTMTTNKVTAGNFKVTLSSSEKVNVIDPYGLHEDFLEYLEPKVKVSAIKEALKNGEKVYGAELVKTPYVTIR